MLHPTLYATTENIIHGKGLVTSAAIAAGDVIWRRDPQMPTFQLEQILQWSEEEQERFFWFAFQCDAETFIYITEADGYIDGYMNHSCDPNTWWLDDTTLVAARDIAAGEEVTYDYATTEISIDYEMQCACGASNCRGKVTNLDYLDLAWQAQYGEHLPSFVLTAIRRSKAD